MKKIEKTLIQKDINESYHKQMKQYTFEDMCKIIDDRYNGYINELQNRDN